MRYAAALIGGVLGAGVSGALSGCVTTNVETAHAPKAGEVGAAVSRGDEELAKLLVMLELRTRSVIAGHYGGADEAHRAWLAENMLLPAAVADRIFHDVVPEATEERAWVKMVVEKPRNPHNQGDATARAVYDEIKAGASSAQRRTANAYYYAQPIKAKKGCLLCHGTPKGEPDPFFPQYKKGGWKEGEIIGAVVARVAREK